MDYYGRYHGPIHISGVTPDIWRAKFIFVGKAVFCSCSKIENGAFYSDLHYIGPAAEAAKYRYNLRFVNTFTATVDLSRSNFSIARAPLFQLKSAT